MTGTYASAATSYQNQTEEDARKWDVPHPVFGLVAEFPTAAHSGVTDRVRVCRRVDAAEGAPEPTPQGRRMH